MNKIIKIVRTLDTRLTVLAALALGATTAHAHPGHTLHEEGVSHFLTSPYHLMGLTLVGLVLCGTAIVARQPAMRRVLAACGGVALLTAAVLWQMPS